MVKSLDNGKMPTLVYQKNEAVFVRIILRYDVRKVNAKKSEKPLILLKLYVIIIKNY